MNDKDHDGFIDQLLEASLAQYSRVEPQPGLEQRLLAGVQKRKQVVPGRSVWQWYVVPAAAAAALLMVGIYLMQSGPTNPPHPAAAAVPRATLPSSAAAPSSVPSTLPDRRDERLLPVRRPARPQRAGVPAAAYRPRQDVFPAPRQPSEEDLVLLRLMQGNSQALEQLLNRLPPADQALEKIPLTDLQIPALAVEPIALVALEPGK